MIPSTKSLKMMTEEMIKFKKGSYNTAYDSFVWGEVHELVRRELASWGRDHINFPWMDDDQEYATQLYRTWWKILREYEAGRANWVYYDGFDMDELFDDYEQSLIRGLNILHGEMKRIYNKNN